MKVIRKIAIFLNYLLLIAIPAGALGYVAWDASSKQTPLYQSSIKMLVIHQKEEGFDPSSFDRAAEKIAKNLSQVIGTEDFLREVVEANKFIVEDLDSNLSDRRRAWDEMVVANSDGTFISVDIFTPSARQSENLASTISVVLTEKASLWHGAGESVTVKIVDSPLTSTSPVKPNIKLNTIAGTAAGFIIGFASALYVHYFSRQRRRKKAIVARQ